VINHALGDLVDARPLGVGPALAEPEMLPYTMRGLIFFTDS
jgi:hypothetical protein